MRSWSPIGAGRRHHFSAVQIGPERYHAAQVTLSRAMRSLRDRGLIALHTEGAGRLTCGFSLTPAGVAAAAQLDPPARSGPAQLA
jgi:hypothetical protein